LRDLVLDQGKAIDALSKKLASNDKTLEIINFKLEGFSSTMKSQLSLNKIIETQLAQLAAAIPV